ncbi:RecF/RecN/SMC N terminal domain-containing protein 1 [Elsinoe fawcettii]|nr:RecF/RecN/SMC N terminal domain-containing protein 1 [Elsinoe fawcettii]
MGKLIRLELFNFKSYKNHHVMHFGDSYFTSIIGPNGSGKSNSMDAISFVLGIKSSHLRSSHLRDLVYRGRVLEQDKINADGDATACGDTNGTTNGTTNGHDEEESEPEDGGTQRGAGRGGDPNTAWVMAVYEDDDGEEQQWKRIITSSGSSEYRINNRRVDAKEYNEALEKESILIKARNFLVFQGDVEAIASQSAKDLTRLIEQISGSLDYKKDYDDLKAELDRTTEIHNTKLQQRRSINSEIKQYQEQKREADNFAKKQDERDEAVITHVLWKLHTFQQTIEESTEEIQKYQEELKEFKRGIAQYEGQLEGARREQTAAKRDVEATEKQIKRKEKQIEETENSVLPINEKVSLSQQKIEKYQGRIAVIAKERDNYTRTVDKLQKDLNNVQRAQTKWEREWRAAQQQTGRELSAADLTQYGQLRAQVNRETAASQIEVDEITRQLKTDEETVKSLQEKVTSGQNQVSRLDEEINELQSRQKDLNASIKAIQRDVEAKKKTFNTMQSERIRTQQKRREIEEKLQEVLRKLADARDSRQESEKDARMRDMVAQLKRLFPGVRGQLWSLCKPKQKKYNVAVSTVLGRHHDAIVVDTEKTAKDCIDYLKAQRAGQATFIPLDTIMHQPPDANLKGMHPGMRLAVDTFEYDSAIERAVSYACGNSIVCDTLQIARHLCYERRVDAKAVTLDGTVISKGGNMTGGQGPDQKNARKWDDSEVDNFHKLKDKYMSDLAALPSTHNRQDEEDELQGELSGLESKRAFVDDELKHLNRNLDSKRRELQNARNQLNEIQPKLTEQSQGLDGLRARLNTAASAVSGVEDRVFADFCRRLGYANIRAYESQQGTMQQEAAQKKLEFTTQISRLQGQLSFENDRLSKTNERIARLEKEVNDAEAGIETLEAEKADLDEALATLQGELEQLNETLEARKETLGEKAEEVTKARREVDKRSKSIQATVKSVEALQEEISSANMARYNTLKTCLIEKIEIPLQRGSRPLSSLPHDAEEAEPDAMDIDEDPSQPQTPEANDYGILIDFSNLGDELKEAPSDEHESTERQLKETIDRLSAELEKMAPHARANERLESTENKLRDYDAQYKTALNDMNRAKRNFEGVKAQRDELFSKAYEHISAQIDTVYKELTSTVSFPLGGMASLSLEEDTEPYLGGTKYHAMPPLKRFRDMEHLSGGEKTMAALALLFAIHTYSPSPFFVLDEVDAALDVANTTRLADYVAKHARPGMQFVVISLKAGLFQNSETLVGVMRDQAINSSRALTLDLRKYADA